MLGYDKLLNETCMFEKSTGIDKFNQKTYDNPIPLRCFTSFDFSNDRNITSQDTVLTKKIFISNEITPDVFDKFDGSEIISIKPVKGLLTGVIGWEVLV